MAKEGDTLDGRYLLRRLLGDGGMGRVFLAENVKLGHKPVAVKTLKPEYLTNKDVVGRFLQEAIAASKVEHDNIVEVFDADVDAATGTPYIVLRYLKGTNLREHLDAAPGRRLPPAEALDCVVPVMGALVATHKQKIIHRDIKPENIFLVRTSAGETVPKLIDFGIAKHLEAREHKRRSSTQAGSVWGTFDYMSPEQARGERAIDFRADVWSVGAVLFEALTGKLPYDVENHSALLQRFLEGPPPRADAVAPDVPADLADAVARALQIDPAKRYPTMAAFISTLIHCANYQSDAARRGRLVTAFASDGAADPRSPPPLADEPTRRYRPRAGSREERLAPSTRTLELVVPEPLSAGKALPVVVGIAAVLVGVVVGLRLHPTPEIAPRAALRAPTPLTRQDAALLPSPPVTPVAAAPMVAAPMVAAPMVAAPVAAAPVAPPRVAAAPMVAAPVAAPRPVAARAMASRPVASRPVASRPVASEAPGAVASEAPGSLRPAPSAHPPPSPAAAGGSVIQTEF